MAVKTLDTLSQVWESNDRSRSRAHFKSGCGFLLLEASLRIHKELRLAAIAKFGVDPYRRYLGHSASAAKRGIEFQLSFLDWWSIWEPRFAERRAGGAVMCRAGDTGPYAPWNVRVDCQGNNAREAAHLRAKRDVQRDWGENAQSIDWLRDKWDFRQRLEAGSFAQGEPEEEEA